MSDFMCRKCGRMKFNDHACPPIYECRLADTKSYGEEWEDTMATGGAEGAAEKFAEEMDCSNEYWILQQGDRCEEVVEVRDSNGAVTKWRITAESVPHYYAHEVEDEDVPDPVGILGESGK